MKSKERTPESDSQQEKHQPLLSKDMGGKGSRVSFGTSADFQWLQHKLKHEPVCSTMRLGKLILGELRPLQPEPTIDQKTLLIERSYNNKYANSHVRFNSIEVCAPVTQHMRAGESPGCIHACEESGVAQ
eukprot:3394858-Amphidinium_carterae.4